MFIINALCLSICNFLNYFINEILLTGLLPLLFAVLGIRMNLMHLLLIKREIGLHLLYVLFTLYVLQGS